MYYFKEQRTLRIVTREHQYNMEAVDGKLTEVSPSAPCLLLAHVPNKNWSYDVNILEKLEAYEAVKRLNPLPQKSDKPAVFYAVVLEQDYNTYMTDYAFKELHSSTKEAKPKGIIKTDPQPRIIDTGSAKTITDSTTKTSNVQDFNYNPSLDRSKEKTVYKFKPGSQRYG